MNDYRYIRYKQKGGAISFLKKQSPQSIFSQSQPSEFVSVQQNPQYNAPAKPGLLQRQQEQIFQNYDPSQFVNAYKNLVEIDNWILGTKKEASCCLADLSLYAEKELDGQKYMVLVNNFLKNISNMRYQTPSVIQELKNNTGQEIAVLSKYQLDNKKIEELINNTFMPFIIGYFGFLKPVLRDVNNLNFNYTFEGMPGQNRGTFCYGNINKKNAVCKIQMCDQTMGFGMCFSQMIAIRGPKFDLLFRDLRKNTNIQNLSYLHDQIISNNSEINTLIGTIVTKQPKIINLKNKF